MTCEKCHAWDRKREGQSSERRVCAPVTPVTTTYCEDLLLNTSSTSLTSLMPQLGRWEAGRVYPAPEQGLRLRTGEESMGWRKKTRCVLQNNVPSRTNTRDENIHLNLQHHNRWREFTNLELFVNTPGGQLLFHGRCFFLQFCWSNKIDSDESVVVVK